MSVIESIKDLDWSANLYSVPQTLKQDFLKKKSLIQLDIRNSCMQVFWKHFIHSAICLFSQKIHLFHSFNLQQRWDSQGVAVDVVSCGKEPRSAQSTQRWVFYYYSIPFIFHKKLLKSTFTKSVSISNSNTQVVFIGFVRAWTNKFAHLFM